MLINYAILHVFHNLFHNQIDLTILHNHIDKDVEKQVISEVHIVSVL